MPEFATAGETLETLILSEFNKEFDAPCPNCNPNHLDDGIKLKRAESTYLIDPNIIVVSLARRRSYLVNHLIDREVEISNNISLPSIPVGSNVECKLISCIQHVDYLGTGNTGHFVSHILYEGTFFKVDGCSPVVKSTMQELRRSSVFMYLKSEPEMFV